MHGQWKRCRWLLVKSKHCSCFRLWGFVCFRAHCLLLICYQERLEGYLLTYLLYYSDSVDKPCLVGCLHRHLQYICESAQMQVSVFSVCFQGQLGLFFSSDQSVLVSLCSLKMFVLLAKHRPINSAWMKKKKANREQNSSKPPNSHACVHLFNILCAFSPSCSACVHCLVKSWQLRLIWLFKKKTSLSTMQNNFWLHSL